ncbi:TonB-dependent receptor [Aurantiacibacter gilvus]|uniref:TonB-dependent receptor n=1 Tax=Aurantiacibacter gilvus TaxID=3139141 RepID=A0ABU9IGM0_9SPHN
MTNRSPALLASVALACLLPAAPALAQDAPPEDIAEEPRSTADDLHNVILVTAAGVDRLDVVAGTSVISGITLQRESAGQIGDVLDQIPGVTASGFAPGASRPVLRGFGGERVRVLTDGVGALDASGASADHAVSVDPLIADRIEVLRGPAVLLYGSSAIGGAVNVITKRIPPRLPTEPVHIDALAGADTAANLREGGLSLDAPLGGGFAFHIDGSYRNTDDIEIPGFAATPDLRADLLADAAEEEEEGHVDEAEELREGANTRDVLPNSWTEATSFGTGLAFFSGDSNIGVSFDYYDTSYGVPGLPGVGHVHGEEEEDHDEGAEGGEEEEGPVSIGMKRYRVDLRGQLDLGDGFFDHVQTRWGWSDYTHTEFEGDETGTVFDVQGIEGRIELVQARHGISRGSIGAQYSHVDFEAIGAEAFVPPSVTENFAVFTLQELDFDAIEVEAGVRYEHTSVSEGVLNRERKFDTFSGALGASYTLFDDFRLGVNLSHAERAPSAQELFADGPHIATQQYEVGNDALDVESAWGVEGYLRGEIGAVQVNASVYRNWFDDFIYLAETGLEEDGLDVFEFLQQDADQWGLEGQVTFPLLHNGEFTLLGDLRGDYTEATLANGDPVPRIPPLSLSGALEAQTGHFDIRAEVEWNDAQNRVAPLETPTDSFTHVNLSVAWHPFEGASNLTVLAAVDNLFDAEGRRHASFTKEFVPLQGRNFRLSVRSSF